MLYTSKCFTAEFHFGISLKTAIPLLITGRRTYTNSFVGSSPNIKVSPFCRCKGVCLLRFPTKLAEQCLLFIAQPCVISQPGFLECSWFFQFPLILICFFLINTLFILCIIFLWFSLASIWSEKSFYYSNTFSMWQVNCKVSSPCLVEHETCMFSRVWLKRDLRIKFEWTTCDKIHFPYSVLACNFCIELNVFMCASFRVFFLNFEGDKFPLADILRDNFNYSAGLAQWRGLAQTLLILL